MNLSTMLKLLSILHYAHLKPIAGPFLFKGTVTGDRYLKMLADEAFPSILNENNKFSLLYAFKCDADNVLKFRKNNC